MALFQRRPPRARSHVRSVVDDQDNTEQSTLESESEEDDAALTTSRVPLRNEQPPSLTCSLMPPSPTLASTSQMMAGQSHSPGSFEAVSGWVVALTILAAIRLGRDQADKDRLDIRSLQLRQEESRVQSAELREKRRAYLESERARKEQEALRSMQEAREQSKAAEKERAGKVEAYRETAAKETARLWEQQQAARRAFEEQEALMGEELTRRTEIEVQLRIEAERKKLQEKETARIEAEARAREEAEAEKKRVAEAKAAEALRMKKRREEREGLREQQVTRTVTFSGRVVVEAAPFKSLTTGSQLSQPARVQVTLLLTSSTEVGDSDAGTTSDSTDQGVVGRYESTEAAVEASEVLSEEVCLAAVAFASTLLKSSPSISSLMDPHEINYWARICFFKCLEQCQQMLKRVVPLSGSSRLEQSFVLSVPHSCLPIGHPMRLDSQLASAAGLVAAGMLDQAVGLVDKVIEDEEEDLGAQEALGGSDLFLSLGASRTTGSIPPLSVAALIYAQLVDRAAGSAGAPAPAAIQARVTGKEAKGDEILFSSLNPSGVQGAAALAKYQLEQRTKKLKEDALAPSASLLLQCLGLKHPVAAAVASLAERTMSVEARMKMEARRQREDLSSFAAAKAAKRWAGANAELGDEGRASKTSTPVAEKLWALRNVANNMIRFGASAANSEGQDQRLSEAVSMLEEADGLASSHYGKTHPARLATLLDYHEGLGTLIQAKIGSVDSMQSRAKIVAASEDAILILQAMSDRYQSQGDSLSSVLVLESALADFSSFLPSRHPGVTAAQEMAASLLGNLTPTDMGVVVSKRSSGGILRLLAKDFNEELGAYTMSRRNSKLEQFRKTGQYPSII